MQLNWTLNTVKEMEGTSVTWQSRNWTTSNALIAPSANWKKSLQSKPRSFTGVHRSCWRTNRAGIHRTTVPLCQYFGILFWRSFPVRNVMRTQFRLLAVTVRRIFEIQDDGFLCRTSGSFMRLAASKIRWCTYSLLFTWVHTGSYSCSPNIGISREREVRWLQWPILRTTTTNTSVRDLLTQVLRHVSTETWGALSHWGTTVIKFCVVHIFFNLYT
jgi:hypothetical protein